MNSNPPPAARPVWLKPGPSGTRRPALIAYSLRKRVERWGLRHLDCLNRLGARFTIRDLYGAPGDTILAATVGREMKKRWPRLRLNFITKNPDLVEHDPCLAQINAPPGPFNLDFWYYDLQQRRDPRTSMLAPTFAVLGLKVDQYRARVYLTEAERAAARERLAGLPKPLIAIATLSAQSPKNWLLANWREMIPALAQRGSLVHLGDGREPTLPSVHALAGKLSKRESMAVMGECDLFVGPDSFLMHVANGLDVPSVIILGGSRTPANSGYATNINLYTELPCSCCWLSGQPGSECPHDMACMTAITPSAVLSAVDEMLARHRPPTAAVSTNTPGKF